MLRAAEHVEALEDLADGNAFPTPFATAIARHAEDVRDFLLDENREKHGVPAPSFWKALEREMGDLEALVESGIAREEASRA